MWTALGQQGVFDSTTVVTGLDIAATWPAYGPVAGKVNFLAPYFGGAAGTGVVLSTRGKEVTLPAGTDLSVRLAAPLTVRVTTSR